MKKTLTHSLSNGRTFTRTTAHDYGFVVVVRDERERDFAAEFAYLAEQPERMKAAIAYATDQAAYLRDDVVLSWHGTEANAAKAAAQVIRNYGDPKVFARVEAVNGGTPPAAIRSASSARRRLGPSDRSRRASLRRLSRSAGISPTDDRRLGGDPMAGKTKTTKTPDSPLADVTTTDVETAIADALAGDPSAAEAITAKATAATPRKRAAAKAKTATPRKPRAKAADPKPEVETPDLTKALLAGLKAEGIEARANISPKGNFYRVVIDERTTIAYVNFRAKGALRVEPVLEGGRAPKGFTAQAKVRNGLGYVATFSTEKEVALAVAALKLAAEKAREAKAAKAAAPAAAAEVAS